MLDDIGDLSLKISWERGKKMYIREPFGGWVQNGGHTEKVVGGITRGVTETMSNTGTEKDAARG